MSTYRKRPASSIFDPLLEDEISLKKRLIDNLSNLSLDGSKEVALDMMDISSNDKDKVYIADIDDFLKDEDEEDTDNEVYIPSEFLNKRFGNSNKIINRLCFKPKSPSLQPTTKINKLNLNEQFVRNYYLNWGLIKYYDPWEVIRSHFMVWLRRPDSLRDGGYDLKYNYWDTSKERQLNDVLTFYDNHDYYLDAVCSKDNQNHKKYERIKLDENYNSVEADYGPYYGDDSYIFNFNDPQATENTDNDAMDTD